MKVGEAKVIQINMEMPKCCAECDLLKVYEGKNCFKCLPDGRYMYDQDKIWMTEQRPNWCPLKEITECKDCKYCNKEILDKKMVWCNLHKFARPENHYCADGA